MSDAAIPETASALLSHLRALAAANLDSDLAEWDLASKTRRGVGAGLRKAIEALEAAGICAA